MALKPRRSVKKRMGRWDQIKTFNVQVSKHSTKASMQSHHAQQHRNLSGVEPWDASQKKEGKENCPSHTLPKKNLNLLIYWMTEQHLRPPPGRMLLCCHDYEPLLWQRALMNPFIVVSYQWPTGITRPRCILSLSTAQNHTSQCHGKFFLTNPKKRTSECDFLSIGSQGTYTQVSTWLNLRIQTCW